MEKGQAAKKEEPSKLKKIVMRSLGGGVSGAIAMVAQVSTLMWMRTIMN